MRLNIRSKLFAGFLFVLVLAYSTQIVSYFITESSLRSQVSYIEYQNARSAGNQVQNFINQTLLDILPASEDYQQYFDPATKKLDNYEEYVGTLLYTLRQNPNINKITILEASTGAELAIIDKYAGATPQSSLNYSIPTAPFTKSLTGAGSVSKVYISNTVQTPQVDLFYPITDTTGVIGVAKLQLNLERLWETISHITLGSEGFAYIVDEDGRLIAHPDQQRVRSAPILSDRAVVAAVLSNSQHTLINDEFIYTNENGTKVVANGTSIPELGWAIIVEQPISQAYAQLYVIRNIFIITLIGSLIVLVTIALILSSNFTSGLRELAQTAKDLRKGEYKRRANVASKDEVGDLANLFNAMVNELSEKITQLETQKKQLDEDAKRLHTQEEKVTKINKELASEKESLVAERNKLSVILEGVTDPVIAVDYDRTVTMFNAAAEKLTGFRAEDVIGHVIERVITLFTPGGDLLTPHEYCPIRSDNFEGIVYQGEELRLRTNNNDLYVNVTSSKIAESESANLGCIITLHDITNERELSRMKLDFVSMAAHELRTPLTTIRGYLEMIKQEALDKLTPQQQMFINRIGIATQQLTGLMENLLSVAKIEKGNYNLTLSQVDWVSLVSNQIETLRPEAKDRGLELNWIHPDNDIPLVHVDPLRITEVLNNLLANAIKYTPKGSVSVWVEYNKDDNIVITHIKDTGQGIPKESLPRMFEKFFRVSGLLEQGSKGTGLGLYITKAIVELHNGSVWVESEEGVGSIFSFSIPAAKDNNNERIFNS